jgi:hypothetical protein
MIIQHNNETYQLNDDDIQSGDTVYWIDFDGDIFTVDRICDNYIWFTNNTCLRIHNIAFGRKTLFKATKQ